MDLYGHGSFSLCDPHHLWKATSTGALEEGRHTLAIIANFLQPYFHGYFYFGDMISSQMMLFGIFPLPSVFPLD